MKPSVNRTWLGIGIVTVAMLLASSAATSPVAAAPAVTQARQTATDPGPRREGRRVKPVVSTAEVPHYLDRPTDYAPAYPPGPLVLFTPFYD
ncbi:MULTISPECIES: hypothetical protein [unclassified Bradyrhizobium]|uniref:hypothetical protein n=1 Tax=unclassified Bradyrhizobium TaxID=2631580 RepID=UPI0028EEDCDB|nr:MULTISPECIES: hypothetical protein [unclassified Bradyrhizobium]